MQAVKIARGCESYNCLWSGPFQPEMLDFHHLDPAAKSFNIGQNMSLAATRVWAEVEKCAVLCRNCHQLEEKFGMQLGEAAPKASQVEDRALEPDSFKE